MTIATTKKSKSSTKKRNLRSLYERLMALLILFNYIIVIFDLTYIPLRDFWLQGKVQMVFVKFNKPVDFLFFTVDNLELKFPPKKPLQVLPTSFRQWITNTYDPIKGIVPYRSTEGYLQLVEEFQQEVNEIEQRISEDYTDVFPDSGQVNNNQTANNTTDKIDKILSQLRAESIDMVNTNPFQVANKTGTLERIKNKMTEHIFDGNNEVYSSKEAFRTFWSKDYLFRQGFKSYYEEIDFFNESIEPLIATNYFRPIGENGEPVDNFGAFDFPFGFLFFIEFLGRTWFISRRHAGLSWFDATLWRWYDIFLFIPIFRWLRIIPLTIRLNQAKLINLKSIQRQASQGFVASIAGDITEVVILRVINQFQGAINDGMIQNVFEQRGATPYIDLNDTDEITEIIKLVVHITVHKVLPEIQPEAEAFLKYNLDKSIQQTPAYQGIQRIPGFKSLETQLTEQIATQLYTTLCTVLVDITAQDPVFDELAAKLAESFTHAMGTGLKAEHSMDRLEVLLKDLLEEIKVNYVQKLSEEDVEEILEQTRQLRQNKGNVVTLTPTKY
ncbi:MAG: hypothetical protein AB4041_15590 [Microcystaceae cyanobacterium]